VISVVTVHGLWMRGASMAILRKRLTPHGLSVMEFGYPSVTGSLPVNARALAEYVDAIACERIHLVGHSLGGVLIRAMLDQYVPPRLGRIVCLGSPLRGSVTAARLARWPGGSRVIGRCMVELRRRGGFDAWPANVEAGGIAGDLPLGIGRLFGPFAEPNDGTVAVAETKVAGLRDHVVLRVSHMALLWSAQVTEQVEHFLLHGRFRR
jgi:pimeloyl-ACP methyl ester carboxylesterase